MECYAVVSHKIITYYTSKDMQVLLCIDFSPERRECFNRTIVLFYIFILLRFEKKGLREFSTISYLSVGR